MKARRKEKMRRTMEVSR
ncbi:hypothetical protein Gohar_001010 [Gossypium harknessii]|uniref:Uncharacterized protein n=1 Tax=Gossypium harknessii TaxID=34285 RepID=A0A7J9I3B7_9ROSI|nr:hypothetical protein [Gossypium harknessii]